MKPSIKYKHLETEYFIIKLSKTAYKKLHRTCRKKGISLDYFFFEFAGYGKHKKWDDLECET